MLKNVKKVIDIKSKKLYNKNATIQYVSRIMEGKHEKRVKVRRST